jgi:hypothetical protein
MTPQERRRVIEVLKTAEESASAQDVIRALAKEMPHLAPNDVAEVCRVYAEEKKLDAAVYLEQAAASECVAQILHETGQPDLEHAIPVLVTRSEHGDRRAAELLEKLGQALTVVSMND